MRDDDMPHSTTPVRVRTRRTLAGNGDVDVLRSVRCARDGSEVPLHRCLGRDCCDGFDASCGATYVRCDDPELAATELVHLPAHAPRAYGLTRERLGATPITAIMTDDVLCVRPDVSVDALVPLLLEHHISGVPVVDASGAPLGIVSKTDIVRERYENGDLVDAAPMRDAHGRGYAARDGYHESAPTRCLVSDVMLGMTFSVSESATVSQAAAVMAYEGVHRVPVTSADGKVVGIVSALDVLRWLAREDGYPIVPPRR
jgi:CBS domain-containing protein